jgi:hypothetical protein
MWLSVATREMFPDAQGLVRLLVQVL